MASPPVSSTAPPSPSGMGLLVTALTVTLAVANHALLRVLRSSMHHIQLLAAAFVVLSGIYLLYYFWVVDVNDGSGAITNAVENLQTRIAADLNDHWQLVAVVLAGIVRRRDLLRRCPTAIVARSTPVASPEREPTATH